MDLMTFVNDPLQLSFDSLDTEIQRCQGQCSHVIGPYPVSAAKGFA